MIWKQKNGNSSSINDKLGTEVILDNDSVLFKNCIAFQESSK
jgi:hypothetical protein